MCGSKYLVLLKRIRRRKCIKIHVKYTKSYKYNKQNINLVPEYPFCILTHSDYYQRVALQ
jgi:hypothetical protein